MTRRNVKYRYETGRVTTELTYREGAILEDRVRGGVILTGRSRPMSRATQRRFQHMNNVAAYAHKAGYTVEFLVGEKGTRSCRISGRLSNPQ